MQHVHILGICGTFMGSIAQLAKAMGLRVTGSDEHVYPPMSTQLEAAGIEIFEGFTEQSLEAKPDLVIVGNVVSRGNPAMEYVLNRHIPYISGPQWLFENVLKNKWVLAVSGTHGKTTTTSMLAWILDYAGFDPGFLIGGVAGNFTQSARLGSSDFFVIEADEYDTAFFDKRAKFVHYHPRTLIVGNLEFDHADIYPDLHAIQTQFHHLMRMLPQQGLVIAPHIPAIDAVLQRGCWSEQQFMGGRVVESKMEDEDRHHAACDWQVKAHNAHGSEFTITLKDSDACAHVSWSLTGEHNMQNAMAAIAAARHIGIDPALSGEALSYFKGVKRRMEVIAEHNQCTLYDDFAHHPTAIATTLAGLRQKMGASTPITLIIEPRSNTMKMGVHNTQLNHAVSDADAVYWYSAEDDQAFNTLLHKPESNRHVYNHLDTLIAEVKRIILADIREHHVVIMSNGGFGGIHQKLATWLYNTK